MLSLKWTHPWNPGLQETRLTYELGSTLKFTCWNLWLTWMGGTYHSVDLFLFDFLSCDVFAYREICWHSHFLPETEHSFNLQYLSIWVQKGWNLTDLILSVTRILQMLWLEKPIYDSPLPWLSMAWNWQFDIISITCIVFVIKSLPIWVFSWIVYWLTPNSNA